nr:MAG TPA: hypothetical protein [Caudoviricetes sp.]
MLPRQSPGGYFYRRGSLYPAYGFYKRYPP